MRKFNISEWVAKNNIKIIFVLFLIEYCITIWMWISANPNINLLGNINYFLWLFFFAVFPYIIKNYLKTLANGSKNFELLYVITIWILARIINFLEFNYVSYSLISFITLNFCFGLFFIAIHAYKTGILIILGLNILWSILFFLIPPREFYKINLSQLVSALVIILINLLLAIKRLLEVKRSSYNE